MPEGDTIFRTARTLGRALGSRPITGFRSTFPLLTRAHQDAPLTGQCVQRVESRGKWLLIDFSGGATLATHMLMSGSWHIYRPGQPWQKPRSHMRILLETVEYLAVAFRVPVACMHTAQSLVRDQRIPPPSLNVLGPCFDAEAAVERILSYRDEEIGDVLLHQEVLAGVGNVFKSEICFLTGINPFLPVRDLSRELAGDAVATARQLLAANVLEDSGDAIVTFRGLHRRTTHASDPAASLWVYGRHGEPCRKCGEPVRRRIQGPDARVTFWCPCCQPMPGNTYIDG